MHKFFINKDELQWIWIVVYYPLQFILQSTDNPWDKLHNTIPLPDGPASLFDHEVDNSHTTSSFDDPNDIIDGKQWLLEVDV